MLMNESVQRIMIEYTRCLREKAMYEKYLAMHTNCDMRDALIMIDIKVGIVESWFATVTLSHHFPCISKTPVL